MKAYAPENPLTATEKKALSAFITKPLAESISTWFPDASPQHVSDVAATRRMGDLQATIEPGITRNAERAKTERQHEEADRAEKARVVAERVMNPNHPGTGQPPHGTAHDALMAYRQESDRIISAARAAIPAMRIVAAELIEDCQRRDAAKQAAAEADRLIREHVGQLVAAVKGMNDVRDAIDQADRALKAVKVFVPLTSPFPRVALFSDETSSDRLRSIVHTATEELKAYDAATPEGRAATQGERDLKVAWHRARNEHRKALAQYKGAKAGLAAKQRIEGMDRAIVKLRAAKRHDDPALLQAEADLRNAKLNMHRAADKVAGLEHNPQVCDL